MANSKNKKFMNQLKKQLNFPLTKNNDKKNKKDKAGIDRKRKRTRGVRNTIKSDKKSENLSVSEKKSENVSEKKSETVSKCS